LFAEGSNVGVIDLVVRSSAISLNGKKETKVNTRKAYKDKKERKQSAQQISSKEEL